MRACGLLRDSAGSQHYSTELADKIHTTTMEPPCHTLDSAANNWCLVHDLCHRAALLAVLSALLLQPHPVWTKYCLIPMGHHVGGRLLHGLLGTGNLRQKLHCEARLGVYAKVSKFSHSRERRKFDFNCFMSAQLTKDFSVLVDACVLKSFGAEGYQAESSDCTAEHSLLCVVLPTDSSIFGTLKHKFVFDTACVTFT